MKQEPKNESGGKGRGRKEYLQLILQLQLIEYLKTSAVLCGLLSAFARTGLTDFLSSPPTPRSLNCAIFCAVFDSRSSFFAPKPLGNACYAGYRTPDNSNLFSISLEGSSYRESTVVFWHIRKKFPPHVAARTRNEIKNTKHEDEIQTDQ